MLYIFNKIVNSEKKIQYALCKIFGLNTKSIKLICYKLGLNPNVKIGKLNNLDLKLLKNYIINNFLIEEKLKIKNNKIIKNQINIKSYKGIRKIFNLPSNGQRTHSNSKTVKKMIKIYNELK